MVRAAPPAPTAPAALTAPQSENAAPASARPKRARASKAAKECPASARKVLRSIQACVGESAAGDVDASMTVEEFLRAQCDAMCSDLREHADGLAAQLEQQLEDGIAEIRASASASAAATAAAPAAVATDVLLSVGEGPYAGQTFRLRPRAGKRHLLVGRSTGKRFRDEGISLPEDPEVSTTHLKVELGKGAKKGRVFVTDMGSTNGTLLNDKEIYEGDQHELVEGTKLQVGATVMVVALACPP